MYPLTFIGSTPKVYVFTERTTGSNGLTGEEREGERERGRESGRERGGERERERGRVSERGKEREGERGRGW